MLSNLQIGNKKPLTGIHQYANNTKIKKFQIITSQSQKNIKSGLTPGKKIETKSRPNTGGSKSPFMPMNRPLSYKDKFSLSNNQGKSTNDSKQNESNLSLNISAIKTIKLNDKQSLSSNRSGYKNGVTNLNLGKSLNNNNMFKARGIKVGPQTTRELSTKNTIVNDSKSKQKSLLNESKSLNNSVSDAIVGNQTRSHSQNLKTTKNSNQGLFGKTNSYSKSPNNRNPPSKKINTKGEKTLNEEKSRSPSPLLSSSYLKKFNNHSNKVPNFSKISTGNLINDKKFRDEQMDVQITNNTKKKSQNNFSMSKLKPNITKFSGNTPLLQNKNDTFEAEPRVNPKKELDLKHRDVDLRKITTSPIVIKKPINLKNENKINQLHTPNIMLVNKEQLSNSNSTQETIKTIKNIHDITKTGFSGTGVKKVNQDNFFIYKNFNSNPNSIYFGVCDGHGVLGHEVSLFLRENLPATVDSELKKRLKKDEINKILDDVFVFTNNKLCNQTMIDTNFRYMEDNISGSTCVTLIYTPEKLICANVGDSRAVLGRCVNGSWTNHDLSRDHKPSDKDESERIIKRKGRIEPFRDENNEFIGPARVWLKDDDIPGLAMSRSFGDQVAGSVGVIAEPEISEWKFTKDDMFFIIASDGVWEFIESEECVNIIKPYYLNNDIQGAAEYIVKESTRRWLKEEEVIDDITLLLVFLN